MVEGEDCSRDVCSRRLEYVGGFLCGMRGTGTGRGDVCQSMLFLMDSRYHKHRLDGDTAYREAILLIATECTWGDVSTVEV